MLVFTDDCRKMKSPPAFSPAGLGLLISLADLSQAMAVRRHGFTVMVVMAVMVAKLHCLHPKGKASSCQHQHGVAGRIQSSLLSTKWG
jgi:hypothetical protein